MRYLKLTDLFETKCKKCGSVDVDLSADSCNECGLTINAYCNNCKSHYDYHDFIEFKD